jgi:hypothetical protein
VVATAMPAYTGIVGNPKPVVKGCSSPDQNAGYAYPVSLRTIVDDMTARSCLQQGAVAE